MEKIKTLLNKKTVIIMAQYVFSLILCLICMYCILDLKQFNMDIPYVYNGDGLSTGLFIKGMIENGWYNINEFVGAPFGLEMYDYPLGGDNFQYFIMKIISWLNFNHIQVMNLYYLLTFPLCMFTSLFALRYLKINYFIALSFSILFTFLPYHILRSGHLFLLGYYIIPLMVLIILWVAHKDDFLIKKDNNNKIRLSFNKYLIVSIVVCAIAGATGAYYAFFSCFFLLCIGILESIREKGILKLLRSLSMILVVCISLGINLSPSLYYKITNDGHSSTSARNFEAAETYGLKITQLLLPTTNHNIDWIKDKKDEYNNRAPLVNENDTSSLGFIISVGFLLLLVILFLKPNIRNKVSGINRTLSEMNMLALLLGTIGGFGTLFAALVTAQIRSYNRISIFIAFFSLLYLALNLDQVLQNRKFRYKKIFVFGISCLILLFGIFDQTSRSLAPSKVIAEEFNSDKMFIEQISKNYPDGAMIFQLPYVSFPEGESLNQMGNYDLLKGYMHSNNMYWSFGSMKGSFADEWMKEVVKLPINNSLEMISITGYKGIYIDRLGYSSDYLAELESKITELTQVTPIESPNKRLLYFDLEYFENALESKYSNEELIQMRKNFISSIPYEENHVINGDEEWRILGSSKGYKIVETSSFPDLPEDQLSIQIVDSSGDVLTFDDNFTSFNQYSYRHWESPKKIVLSLDNSITGWDEDYIPSELEIQEFFKNNNYQLSYTTNNELSLNE